MKRSNRRRSGTPVTRLNVTVLMIADDNATVAHAAVNQLDMHGWRLIAGEATGSAKREPGDTRDDTIAANLALGRALINLGTELLREGTLSVVLSVEGQQIAARDRVERKLKGVKPPVLLPISHIAKEWGQEAADRAARRRGQGRHALPEPGEA